VTDQAAFLSPAARDALDARLGDYAQKTGHQVIVYIGNTTGGVPIEDWAVRAFARWRVGRKGIDDGVALFIFSDDRKLRIEVGYGLEDKLTDAAASRIIRERMVPRIRAGDRDGAVNAGVDAILAAVGAPAGTAPAAGQPAQAPPQHVPLWVWIVGAFVLVGFVRFAIRHPFLASMLMTNIGSGRRDRWGGGGGGFGGGGFGGGGVGTAGPFVLSGSYKVSLVVDGKTVDTKTLRVNDDPDVVLTSVERKRMFDQAMEMHTLQARLVDAATAHRSLAQQITQLATRLNDRSDVPGDVKSAFDAVKKDVDALATKLAIPAGGRGGGGRGAAAESLLARLGQAKNGLMAGMAPGEQTTTAYADVKTQAPKAIADLNAAIAKATPLAASLTRYNLTLTVPAPVKADTAAPARKTTNGSRG
jgi:uncharacterized protein